MVNESQAEDAARLVKLLARRGGIPAKVGTRELELVATKLRRKKLTTRTTFEKAGTVPERVWIILEGTVRLVVGNKTLDVINAPAILGDDHALRVTELLTSLRSDGSVTALTLPADEFGDILAMCPGLAVAWMGEMAAKADHDRRRSWYLLQGDLVSQLAGLLSYRAESGCVALTQGVLASMLNVHRASVNRALKSLVDAGLIEVGYREVRVKDLRKLQAVSEGLKVEDSKQREGPKRGHVREEFTEEFAEATVEHWSSIEDSVSVSASSKEFAGVPARVGAFSK